MTLTKKSTVIFFLLFLQCFFLSSEIWAQEYERALLALRAKSVENIESMIAGVDRTVSSPLKGIESPIKKSKDSKVFYNHIFNQKREYLIDKFTRFGVTRAEIENALIEAENEAKLEISPAPKDKKRVLSKSPSSAMRRKARFVFKQFTDEQIPLGLEKNEGSAATASDTKVYIDEEHMKTYTSDEQSWTLGHEIGHVLGKHYSGHYAIKELLKKRHGILMPEMKTAIKEYSRYCETISDVNSVVIGGISFAKGYEGFAKKGLLGQDNASVTIDATAKDHPAWVHRHNEALLLREELELLRAIPDPIEA